MQVLSGALSCNGVVSPVKRQFPDSNDQTYVLTCNNLISITERGFISLNDFPVSCSMCNMLSASRFVRQRFVNRFITCEVMKTTAVAVDNASVLFWYDGQTRRKLLILYGFRTGKYYR